MDFGTPRSMSNPSHNDPAIAAKIYRDTNPEPDQHNYGQPIVPDIDDYGKQRSKFVTDCKKEQQASLQCIMDNYENKGVCNPFYDAYKTCRKAEHDRRLEENYRMSGGGNEGACCIM